MSLPAIPDPASAPVEVLQERCLMAREWADSCEDIGQVLETHELVCLVESFLAKRGMEAPAQEAARWLEVRIGELLDVPLNGAAGHGKVPREVPKNRRFEFRQMAANRQVVASMVPTSRRAILKAIRQQRASDKPDVVDTATGVYPAIVIDPPWRYTNVATRGAAEDHYPTMSIDELCKLEIPAADDAHLYLWVTNGFLREGFVVLDAWGFTYKTCLTWCKPQIGMGNWFRNSTEHVYFAVKGKLPTQRNNVPTWFVSDRTKHSAKPESFYDLVVACSPGPYLEMFARQRRMGWDWRGNEA